MSIFKSNKFFRIIKHFILCLPLMFVLGVSLYAIVNPNAKDSYYGDTINEEEYIDISLSNMIVGNTYFYAIDNGVASTDNTRIEIAPTDNKAFINGVEKNDVSKLIFYVESGTTPYFFYWDLNGAGKSYVNLNTYGLTLQFGFSSYSLVREGNTFANYFYFIQYNQYSYLNNAFEFGLYQFTQIGFGQFDFISLFNGIFITNINNVYATFINDYINYYLFVEIVYFAPWVFHAFIHFAYDLGDYFTSSFKRNRKEDD